MRGGAPSRPPGRRAVGRSGRRDPATVLNHRPSRLLEGAEQFLHEGTQLGLLGRVEDAEQLRLVLHEIAGPGPRIGRLPSALAPSPRLAPLPGDGSVLRRSRLLRQADDVRHRFGPPPRRQLGEPRIALATPPQNRPGLGRDVHHVRWSRPHWRDLGRRASARRDRPWPHRPPDLDRRASDDMGALPLGHRPLVRQPHPCSDPSSARFAGPQSLLVGMGSDRGCPARHLIVGAVSGVAFPGSVPHTVAIAVTSMVAHARTEVRTARNGPVVCAPVAATSAAAVVRGLPFRGAGELCGFTEFLAGIHGLEAPSSSR
jgi:hypothetical protein